MKPMKDKQQVLREPFNIHIHNKYFSYYCEVLIHPDGLIEYCVPSHERKLVEVYAKIHNISVDDADEICARQDDHIDFLMNDTRCVFVWYDHLYNGTNLTEEQHEALHMLLKAGCIDDRCLDDIQIYSPYVSAYERRKALISHI